MRKAKNKIKKNNIEIIAITGSFGKTTTKTYLYEVLKNEYIISMSPSSYNTLNGLAITINNLRLPSEKLILEYGASHKNDISKLIKFVKPKIAIVTGIGNQHLETFKTIDNIIKEKMLLVDSLDEDGFGVINFDDENIFDYEIKTKAKIIKVGTNKNCDYIASQVLYNENGLSFKINSTNNYFNINTSLLGRHNVTNILAVVAICDYFKVPKDRIEREISLLKNPSHRLELLRENNYLIIDDSFNSNLQGFLNALEVLSFYDQYKVVITPGIVEGKNEAKNINEKVAKKIIEIANYVFLVTSESSMYYRDFFHKNNYNKFEEVYSTKEAFKNLILKVPRGVVLIENDISDYYKF